MKLSRDFRVTWRLISGRFKLPQLDRGALTAIGEIMVVEQKARWTRGINALGVPAIPLTTRYGAFKSKVRRTASPIRDMQLTGMTVGNFQLRKAINGTIRAENSTREARKRAQQANNAEPAGMIGFAPSDQVAVFKESQKQYGGWLKNAWVPLRGGR